ncbi:TetR/AcrR family transcriptional regulator [Vulgatibacter sp.]|uniref:TetR/AcrR family transcriptional regulator n=1 Tax=Vulgatibacter sp. TaxID=1971226 RepID=UPI00356A3D67
MRYKPEHKQATRARILAAAGKLFRSDGLAGASVDRVMRGAGLTIGGFYGHFASKEALVAETLRSLLQRYRAAWLGGLEELEGAAFLDHFARRYLTVHNRDDESGCAMPSILSELGRSAPEVQAVLEEEVEPLFAALEARLPPQPSISPRQRALATLSLIFGAMALARATRSTALSDEFLAAARAFLGAEAAATRRSH